jgi:tetratricopeptide (TPR) repeat protein
MTMLPPRHCWAVPTADEADGELPAAPQPHLNVRCHRRLRGPYTGAGSLLRSIVPELLESDADLVAARATEITALAPELTPTIPMPPQTLTNLAVPGERTRFYPAARTLRLSQGVAELVLDWARILRPGGVVIAFEDLDDADPTDRELVATLLRRCDPALVTVVAQASGADDELGLALASAARRVTARPAARPARSPGADLAQLFIDSDGTSQDPALQRAYAGLPPQERARRHTARAAQLAATGEPTLRLGAVPYHLEHGTDPAGAGGEAVAAAVNDCFDLGYYEATMELALRGRRIIPPDGQPKRYWNLTHKVSACLSYLGRGEEAFHYLAELRRGSISAEIHMNTCYMMAMLYTRHLPKDAHDQDAALEWVNTAIAIADRHPDPHRRVFTGAFMRNARALVEMHRGDLVASLDLVNEGIAMTDADLQPDEQLLHRSVLLYNRAQILAAMSDHAGALLDYDEVIRRDPDYGDYYFERAAIHRAAGQPAEALADYATAIRLSPPFHEAHFNRADLLRELGEDDAALPDLDYALELEPSHVDSLVNRVDLLLARDETERARADIDHGLALDPGNVNLLTARGSLLADDGDTEAAYEHYTAALTQDPGFVAAWVNRAVLCYSAGRVTEAARDLDHAIALTDEATLRANRAIALQDLGEHRRALEDLDIAVAAPGDLDPDLLYLRGVSRHALGDVEGAHDDWRAHLAAYGTGETSPYAEQIQLPGGKAAVQGRVAESVA